MKILDNLKTIFESKFRDLFSNNKITIFDFSRNTQNVLEIKEGEKLSIDYSKATEQEKKLIKQNFGNMTDAAYEVGFDNLSYFSKCFKQIYKQSPLEFEKNFLNNKEK